MTQQTAPPQQQPTAQQPRPASSSGGIGFGRVVLTVLHLAALGVLGWIVFGLVSGLLAAGVGAVFALGIGLVILVGLVYVLFGLGWFEVERVRGLYRFNTGPLRFSPSPRPGFGGWLRSLLHQSIDPRMWFAIANFFLATLFGTIVLALAQAASWWAAVAFSRAAIPAVRLGDLDLAWIEQPLWALIGVPLALAAILALGWWHAIISRALLGSPSRRELEAEAHAKSAQREGAVRAADVERTRIERDLHDGVQPRLVSIGMTLGLAQQKIDGDPDAAKQLIGEAHTSTKAAITELRQLARGIHASVLDDRGLDAALSALAGRSHVPVYLDVRLEGAPVRSSARAEDPARPAEADPYREAEAAVYFSIAEALTNAAKHSRAAECRVTVRLRTPGTREALIWARVEDNGIGGATLQPGGGLDGISNRVLAAGGTFQLDSPQGGPTTLEVSVPCAF